jgi:hypothetical protein
MATPKKGSSTKRTRTGDKSGKREGRLDQKEKRGEPTDVPPPRRG